jgi:hypothetical protein
MSETPPALSAAKIKILEKLNLPVDDNTAMPLNDAQFVEALKCIPEKLNIAIDGGYILKRIRLQKEAWQFAPYDAKSPIAFLDAFTKESEPNGSKIIRFLADNFDDKLNGEFPFVNNETAEKIAWAAGVKPTSASITSAYPKLTAITPVGNITSVGAFRDNPEFDEYAVNLKVPMPRGKKWEAPAAIAREYYEKVIELKGWKALIDWHAVCLYPHTIQDTFLGHFKIDIDYIASVRENESVKDAAKRILSMFDILNYYMPSFHYDAIQNNQALHTAHVSQDTLHGDPEKKEYWGLNFIATGMVNEAIAGFSPKARGYIARKMRDMALQLQATK